MIGGKPFTFSPAVFDSLLGHGAAGAAKMRELGEAVHVSVSSIKDWRRGAHRACRRATPYVGESDTFVKLLGFCDIMTETALGEDGGKWLPDPDMLFDPHEEGYVSPMEDAELKGRKLLDEVRDDLVALRGMVCE